MNFTLGLEKKHISISFIIYNLERRLTHLNCEIVSEVIGLQSGNLQSRWQGQYFQRAMVQTNGIQENCFPPSIGA